LESRKAQPLPPLGSLAADYAPLVSTCRAFGIGRTRAFAYAKSGLLKTVQIGTTRMVYVDSVRTLPERLAATGGAT
jgi:hypothetical protein